MSPADTPTYTARETLIRRGQHISEQQQCAALTLIVIAINTVLLGVLFRTLDLIDYPIYGLGILIALPWLRWLILDSSRIRAFRRDHRDAWDAGQQKLRDVPDGERNIFKTDEYGDPVIRKSVH